MGRHRRRVYTIYTACEGTSNLQQICQTLRLHGGRALVHNHNEDTLILAGITHIISTTFDFPEYDSACDALIPVVKPNWIDASLARDKLTNPRQYNPDPRLFLSDVVVCCADLPEGDADAIAGGVLAMGGLYTSKITNQVTHVVALTMESEKCGVVESKRLNIKIVLPHWFDDCLKLGRRIDEGPYLLPDPEILRQQNDQPPRVLDKHNVTGATDPDPSSTPSPTPPSGRETISVFENRKIMLSNDLGIGSHLKGILENLITSSGGKLTAQIRKTDMYICKDREGNEYRIASRLGKEVGNLAWLYYMITNNAWTSPMRRLLHYPIASKGLPGFKNLRISLSNYSGEARVYLENLVLASGAECTKTLKQDNTHLITAHVMSEKCAAAKDWGIHLVNHLWLEESYAKWRILSVTDPRYTHFPSRTNLGEIVGQTKIDRDAMERNFFGDDDVDMEDVDEAPKAVQPGMQTRMNGLVPQSSALSSPAPQTNGITPKGIKDVRKVGDQEKLRTPGPGRFLPTGKENETPSTTGSRKSKDAAVSKLHNLVLDIALYEKEKKRVGGVVHGGRRKNDEDRIQPQRKRSIEEATDSDDTEESEQKRPRKGIPPPAMHLLITGYKKWVNHPKIEDSDKRQLRSLGIIVTQEPSRATHLTAPTVLRTHKFVSALAYAPTVISTDFIDACLEQDELLNADHYKLKDDVKEKKHGFSLALSHERAKENRNQLLGGRTIFCMENIHGGFETFKSIVEANGGQCNRYQGRPGTTVPSRRADSESATEDDSQNEVFLLSGLDKENVKVWNRFKAMAEGSRRIPRIVKADWLLETAMTQKIVPARGLEIAEAMDS